MRSYRSALTYWTAWLQGRYGQPLGDAPLPVAVVVQFVLDHLACPQDDGAGRTFCRLHWIRLCWPPGHADAIIFWFPTQKSVFDAIWDIIDHNGLVRRVNLPQVEPAPGVSVWARR